MKVHTKDYSDEDFACRCGKCGWSRGGAGTVPAELMATVQAVRDVYGGDVRVISGRRCHSHSHELTGSSNSYHTRGLAADLVAYDLQRLADAAASIPNVSYIELRDDHVHIDLGRIRRERVVDVRTVREVSAV